MLIVVDRRLTYDIWARGSIVVVFMFNHSIEVHYQSQKK